MYHEGKKKLVNAQNNKKLSSGRYGKLSGTDNEMAAALNVYSVLPRL